jgi:hypothetical protein
MKNQKIRHKFIKIGVFFLKIAGFERIDVAFDHKDKTWCGMVFSSTESFKDQYYGDTVDLVHYNKKYGKI